MSIFLISEYTSLFLIIYRQFVKSLSINFILMFMYEDDDDDDDDDDDGDGDGDDDDDDDDDVEAFTVLLLTMCCCLYYYAVVDAVSGKDSGILFRALHLKSSSCRATLSGNTVLFREHDCNRKTLKLSLMPNRV
uniref:Uncharacterized protein n=1 Tax=Glossina palpalis gambiensis TaxID=67801 RepID=A0A1B0BZ61_9MUSC